MHIANSNKPEGGPGYPGYRKQASEKLIKLLGEIEGGSFLEVGIGPKFRKGRLKTIAELNIDYTGLDFVDVCEMHRLRAESCGLLNEGVNYITNHTGTYLYNLIKLKRKEKRFDLIYLDGHHTMYVDFAAAFACLPLLKTAGYFAFDDVNWTLASKEDSLKQSEFYSDLYDFSLYTEDEKKEAHIEVIVEEYMIPEFGLTRVEEFCIPGWTVLTRL